jgi:hypothetical protein
MIAKLGIAAAALIGSVGFATPASAHEWGRRYEGGGGYRHFERERWEQMRRHRFIERAHRRWEYNYYAPSYWNY